jgi:AcrR family transcriptional regulator
VLPTKRLTRAETRDRTRRGVIAAAANLFLRDGFGAVSLEQIAEQAGYTRGAVYSNFESKTALGIAVIDELYTREEGRLQDALTTCSADDPGVLFDTLSAWANDTIGDARWMRLEIELAASSTHDHAHRAATATRYARQRARCAELINEHFGSTVPIDVSMLATAIIGLALGIGAQCAADPDIPGSTWSEIIRVISASLAGRP